MCNVQRNRTSAKRNLVALLNAVRTPATTTPILYYKYVHILLVCVCGAVHIFPAILHLIHFRFSSLTAQYMLTNASIMWNIVENKRSGRRNCVKDAWLFSFAVRSFVHSFAPLSLWLERDGKFVFNLAWYVYVSAAKYEITFERKTENEFENWNREKLLYWAFFYVNNFLIWHALFFYFIPSQFLFFFNSSFLRLCACRKTPHTHFHTLNSLTVAKQKVICFLPLSLTHSPPFARRIH